MNIYVEYFYNNEGVSIENLEIDDNYYTKLINDYLLENDKSMFVLLKGEFQKINLNMMLIMFSIFSKKTKMFFRENIINKLNKNFVIHTYINILVNSLTTGNKQATKLYMKSLVDTGLVKSIKLKNNIFILKTLDNRKIKFTKLLDTLDEVNRFKKNCHSSSFIIMNKLNSNDTNCVTILEKDVFYNERYHSFLVHNNMVNDYARNILISFDDYMFLFEPNVIYNENSEIVLRNIIELNSSDMEFRKTEYCYLLKYAINKQIYSK